MSSPKRRIETDVSLIMLVTAEAGMLELGEPDWLIDDVSIGIDQQVMK